MTMERMLFGIAGAFVLASTALGYFVSPWWFLFTAFVGANMFQSSFTNWCPMMWLLGKLGVKRACQVSPSLNSAQPVAPGGSPSAA